MLNERRKLGYIQLFKQNLLFKDLEESTIVEILKEFREDVWPKHTCKLPKGHTMYRFYIIVSGRVKIYQTDQSSGRELTLFLLAKNDVFDLICLLENCEHNVYYETLDKVKLLSIPLATMKTLIEKYPAINKNLLPYLGRQIRILEEYASNITLADISSRLAKLILKHINNNSRELELINDLPNDELANLIGSTRAVVNRHLQQFKNDGILKIGRKKVEIKNIELLIKQAENNHSNSKK